MRTQRFTLEFKGEVVTPLSERGYAVAAVCARFGVSSHSPYKWVKALSPGSLEKQAAELIEAKRERFRLNQIPCFFGDHHGH